MLVRRKARPPCRNRSPTDVPFGNYVWMEMTISSRFPVGLAHLEIQHVQTVRWSSFHLLSLLYLYIDLHSCYPAERLKTIGCNSIQPDGSMQSCFLRKNYKPSTKPFPVSYPSALAQQLKAPNYRPVRRSLQHPNIRETCQKP